MIQFLAKYKISIILFLTILILCFMKTSSLPDVEMTDFDKLVHFLIFGGLSGIIFFDNTRYFRNKISRNRILLGSALFPTLFSGLIEILQEYLTTYRSGDWRDFLFDVIGIFFATLICLLINRSLKNTDKI